MKPPADSMKSELALEVMHIDIMSVPINMDPSASTPEKTSCNVYYFVLRQK